jgi:hypothetical protein
LATYGPAPATLDPPRVARSRSVNPTSRRIGRSVNPISRQRATNSIPRPRSPTWAEIFAAPIKPSIWDKRHPECLKDINKVSFAEVIDKVDQEHKERKKQKRQRKEERRTSRPLDGYRSGTSSPALSRINSSIWNTRQSLPNLSRTNSSSFFRLGTSSPSLSRVNSTTISSPLSGLKRADTGSNSINSDKSGKSSIPSRISSLRSITSASSSRISSFRSTNSPNTSGLSRVSSFLSRTQSVALIEDDRKFQGHEAQQEQRVRRSEPGADSRSDTAPHERQRQRRFFGIYPSKSTE